MGGSQSAPSLGKHSTAKEVIDHYQQDLRGRVAVITGGSSGIGLQTCKALASAGARVILCSRNLLNGEMAVQEEIKATTAQGFETVIGTNFFGHFYLTKMLSQRHKSRIVVVSSSAHAWALLHLDDLHCRHRSYQYWNAYAESKLANILFAKALANRLKGSAISVFSLHPGIVKTSIQKGMNAFLRWMDYMLVDKTVPQGASTTVYACIAPELESLSGAFLDNCAVGNVSANAQDPEGTLGRALWHVAEIQISEAFRVPPAAAVFAAAAEALRSLACGGSTPPPPAAAAAAAESEYLPSARGDSDAGKARPGAAGSAGRALSGRLAGGNLNEGSGLDSDVEVGRGANEPVALQVEGHVGGTLPGRRPTQAGTPSSRGDSDKNLEFELKKVGEGHVYPGRQAGDDDSDAADSEAARRLKTQKLASGVKLEDNLPVSWNLNLPARAAAAAAPPQGPKARSAALDSESPEEKAGHWQSFQVGVSDDSEPEHSALECPGAVPHCPFRVCSPPPAGDSDTGNLKIKCVVMPEDADSSWQYRKDTAESAEYAESVSTGELPPTQCPGGVMI